MEVPSDLVFNFIVDLRKKDIHPIDRAKIISEFLKENKLTINKLASSTGISSATLYDWVNYGKIEKRDYDRLVSFGISKTEVFKALRNSSYKRKGKFDSFKQSPSELNLLMEDINSKLSKFITNPVYDNKTIVLIKELRNTLNRLELHIERTRK